LEAYYRNALPPGEYPYPFWHSADKWTDYERTNELKFYFNHGGNIFVGTRSNDGSEADRGTYAHVTPPVFDGNWQWIDASGHLQPRASLFSNRYNAANPYLGPLGQAYRDFATQIGKGTCLTCHAPNNESSMDHLVLLQTPVHASREIDNVLREVQGGKMPQDDLGLRKEIAPEQRAAIYFANRRKVPSGAARRRPVGDETAPLAQADGRRRHLRRTCAAPATLSGAGGGSGRSRHDQNVRSAGLVAWGRRAQSSFQQPTDPRLVQVQETGLNRDIGHARDLVPAPARRHIATGAYLRVQLPWELFQTAGAAGLFGVRARYPGSVGLSPTRGRYEYYRARLQKSGVHLGHLYVGGGPT
jgi:hypothetical protein